MVSEHNHKTVVCTLAGFLVSSHSVDGSLWVYGTNTGPYSKDSSNHEVCVYTFEENCHPG